MQPLIGTPSVYMHMNMHNYYVYKVLLCHDLAKICTEQTYYLVHSGS